MKSRKVDRAVGSALIIVGLAIIIITGYLPVAFGLLLYMLGDEIYHGRGINRDE
jgi:hypothetical protein